MKRSPEYLLRKFTGQLQRKLAIHNGCQLAYCKDCRTIQRLTDKIGFWKRDK